MIHRTRTLLGAALFLNFVSLALASAESGPEIPPTTPSVPVPQFTPPPPAPPSQIDPGILKQPEHLPLPNPEAVVRPPVVDPHMAIDPEKPNRDSPSRPAPTPSR